MTTSTSAQRLRPIQAVPARPLTPSERFAAAMAARLAAEVATRPRASSLER